MTAKTTVYKNRQDHFCDTGYTSVKNRNSLDDESLEFLTGSLPCCSEALQNEICLDVCHF